MRKVIRRAVVAAVLVLGVLPTTMGAAGGCGEMGDTGAQHRDPITDNADGAKKIKFTVKWKPEVPVHIWTSLDGHVIDHGNRTSMTFTLDGLAKNSAGLDAQALYRPEKLYCDLQVGWTHYEMSAAVNKGEWTCFAHWPQMTKA